MQFMDLNGVRIACEEAGGGDKTPVVFVHGWTADMHRWDMPFTELSKERRVVRFDLRGHGQSEKPVEKYTIQQFADDLLAVMDRLGIPKAVLVGHSMGGMTVQLFTLQHPERVDRLILVNTIGRMSYSFSRAILPYAARLMPFSFFVRLNILRGFSKEFPKDTLEEFIALSQRTPKHVVMSCFDAMFEFDVLDRLKEIKAKTLIIHSEQDQQLPLPEARKIQERLSDVTMTILDCGHETPIQAPEKVTEAMKRFLNE